MQSSILTNCGEAVGNLVSLSNEIEIQLTGNELFELNGDARGTQIASTGGNLWVTQQGDEQDYLLSPGENVKITRKGKVLVQAFPQARLRIFPAEHRKN